MEEVVVKKKKGVQYFTQETEDSIVLYNNTPDPEVRSTIYRTKIHYAFFKLTENIIHTFKFYYTEVDNIEDLQHEVITFLLSKLHLFNPDKGAKAYSYFGTIAKRYLIVYNNNNYKKLQEHAGVEELDEDRGFLHETIKEQEEQSDPDNFIDQYIKYVDKHLYQHNPILKSQPIHSTLNWVIYFYDEYSEPDSQEVSFCKDR